MRGGTIALGVAGLGLLVGAPLVWLASRPPDAVGTISRPVTGAPVPLPEPTRAVAAGGAEAVRSRDPLASVRPVDRAAPVAVVIPTLGMEARIVPVGVESNGEMEIPEDVTTVGWYQYGPLPGEVGSTVLAGHVDSRSQGRGAFYDLTRLVVGDRIEVLLDDGSRSTYEVRGRDVVDKAVIALDDFFERDGPPRLTLITCGGPFDFGTGHYLANVVVVAVPVDA